MAFIVQAVIFFAGLFKIYTDMQVRFREIEVRLQAVEKQDDEMYLKLDRIMETLKEIQLEMKDKLDRP